MRLRRLFIGVRPARSSRECVLLLTSDVLLLRKNSSKWKIQYGDVLKAKKSSKDLPP